MGLVLVFEKQDRAGSSSRALEFTWFSMTITELLQSVF